MIQTNGPYSGIVRSLILDNGYIYAGTTRGVFRFNNNGTNWTKIDSGFTNEGIMSQVVSGNNIFAGTYSGRIFRSTNNGTSWTNWTKTDSGLSDTTITSLAVSGNNIFAGTYKGVYRSTNNGTSWSEVNSGITNRTTLSLTVNSSTIFALTLDGVYRSTDNGTSWSRVDPGLTSTRILSIAANDSTVFAGTQYSGVWRLPLIEATAATPKLSPIKHELIKLISQRINNSIVIIEFSLLQQENVSLSIVNLSGQEVGSSVDKNFGPGVHTITLKAHPISSGFYIARIKSGAHCFAKDYVYIR